MDPTARTAMARRIPSRPARELADRDLVRGRVLDYGSGRGLDAEVFGWEAYDPHHGPEMPTGRFDTILVTYVLNVLPRSKQAAILEDVRGRLRTRGRAYLTVRRDLSLDSKPPQRLVVLDLPVVVSGHHFVIYRLDAEPCPVVHELHSWSSALTLCGLTIHGQRKRKARWTEKPNPRVTCGRCRRYRKHGRRVVGAC